MSSGRLKRPLAGGAPTHRCLLSVPRFRGRFLQRQKAVQVLLEPEQEAEEEAAQVSLLRPSACLARERLTQPGQGGSCRPTLRPRSWEGKAWGLGTLLATQGEARRLFPSGGTRERPVADRLPGQVLALFSLPAANRIGQGSLSSPRRPGLLLPCPALLSPGSRGAAVALPRGIQARFLSKDAEPKELSAGTSRAEGSPEIS